MIPFKVGDILKYKNTDSGYHNSIGVVTEVNSSQFRVKLLEAGDSGYTSWNSGNLIGTFYIKDVWKFHFQRNILTKEERVIAKIKYLDEKWYRQQIKKGNQNALRCL